MKKTIITCDVEKCSRKGLEREVEVCTGYAVSRGHLNSEKIKFKPFKENIAVRKINLCKKHFEKWARITYEFVYGKVKT